jgi:hypothetical protein
VKACLKKSDVEVGTAALAELEVFLQVDSPRLAQVLDAHVRRIAHDVPKSAPMSGHPERV